MDQGIKRMTPMYFMHGLFLTCTQKSHLYLHDRHFGIYTMYKQSFIKPPCINKESPLSYLEGQLLARGDEFPSTLVPSLVTTAPPLGFYPFHSFPTLQFPSHCLHRRHQQSWSSWTGTVTVNKNIDGVQKGEFILSERQFTAYFMAESSDLRKGRFE
jgi:hypothetical protein